MWTFKDIPHSMWLVRKTWITRGARLYYSQYGEDAVLREIISPTFNNGVYVDVGAYHPIKFSNTYALYRRGWRGINIDMDPVKIEAFKLARSGDTNVCAAISNEKATRQAYIFSAYGLTSTIEPGEVARRAETPVSVRNVETTTLNDVLANSCYSAREIDLLSIDAEGHDYQVLRSIDINKYRPKIVIVESTLMLINDIMKSAIYRYLVDHDYRLVGWTHLSLIFRLDKSEIFRFQL
ncbi:FkbM family methyltransferase [Paraburkholderia sp. RL18-103-BIB-C]|jgi:FkbM family methyltransferase|uniref:FkbM family methyltransferase n=1 Tax=unclassified Paraburkholderia TaxID=2615204 RepID=UPI0038BD5245